MELRDSFLKISPVLTALLVILSIVCSSPVDKSTFNTATFVLGKLPLSYYLGLMLLALALIIAPLKSTVKVSFTVFLVITFVLYLEVPRLMYFNGFQMEYLHQAQVFHVINYGTFTDKYYIFPRSDVAHAAFSAILIEITALDKFFMVSNVIPILLKLSLTLIALIIALRVKNQLRKLITTIIPVYILVCDTEPAFTNHYIYALPIYATIIFTLLRYSDARKHRVLTLITLTSLSLTHIYFATLTMVALVTFLIYKLFTKVNGSLQSALLPAFVFFLLWHGYISDWSVHKFHMELIYVLSKAYSRLLTFHVNPAGYVIRAYGRFGHIPMRMCYEILLWIKWLTVTIFNVLIIVGAATLIVMLVNKYRLGKALLTLLRNPISWLWMYSAMFIILYVFTVTGRPQRTLEAFIIPSAGALIYLLSFLKKCEVFRTHILAYILMTSLVFSAISVPLKVTFHWGTSLTYIGFTEKYITELLFIIQKGKFTTNLIYFIGVNPFWFFSEIYSNLRPYVNNLNAPIANTAAWAQSLKAFLINTRREHVLLVDFTSGYLPLNAKYDIKPLINMVATQLLQRLARESNLIYMNSIYTYIVYA